MREAGLSGAAVSSFERAWRQTASGETGLMPEAGLESAGGIPALADAASASPAPSFLDRLCVIKLNGGLGTGMGLERAKSLIRVKDGLTFLDLIAQQILWMRETHGTRGPKFLLMDSFSTSADTVSFLAKYPELASGGALDFLQNKVPKILADSLEPVEWAAAPDMEWCPPGHGDLYAALSGSGLLDQLAADGVEYLFVSNSDNLGATADPGLLAYFAGSGLSFLMEVAERTSSDRKGGHLARRMSDGRLVLREVAQCPAEDMETFQDIARHRFFNTNNLWLRVSDLRAALAEHGGSLPLPLITNSKTVDPRDPGSPKVLQLESAMGAAIECFPRAGAVLVPRTRFSPVKTTSDLLVLRSDAYVVTRDRRLELAPGCRGTPPEVVLDGDCYKLLPGLEAAFGEAAPSLCGCSRFEVHGPWLFETGVVCGGAVRFVNDGGVPARARRGTYRDVTESA
ncbi:MAG: UTP--glucose-1-phosphate uridylyltransferase [Chthoniobacterales bacterium]|nr:UTP--glucose-1-phosphate uridylyltransferase [Chthoniobacterales bacterium]